MMIGSSDCDRKCKFATEPIKLYSSILTSCSYFGLPLCTRSVLIPIWVHCMSFVSLFSFFFVD